MRETKSVPETPRYAFAESMAHRFLLAAGTGRFPVKAAELAQCVPCGMIVMSCSEAREKLGIPDPLHIRALRADARTVRMRSGGPYITVYEDQLVKSRERIGFSLMHELGHVVLGHLTDFDETALCRGGKRGEGLGEDQSRALEKEADAFAGEMLAPAAFFRYTDVSRDQLRLLCGLSDAAAQTRMDRILALKNERPGGEDEALRHLLLGAWNERESLIRGMLREAEEPVRKRLGRVIRICPRCGCLTETENAEYCTECGSRLKEAEAPGKERLPLRFDGGYCPRCGSDLPERDGLFCRICGTPVRNLCLREHVPAPPSARFCPACGSPCMRSDALAALIRTREKLEHYPDTEKWSRYPYFDYLKDRVLRSGDSTLYAALGFSAAYVNEENDLLFLCREGFRRDLVRGSSALLEFSSRFESRHPCMGVYEIGAL